MDIINRTGILAELLTDQGTVFVGKLMTQLCQRLGVKKLTTFAYHPKTDGCLEQWHSTLKRMLLKCHNAKNDWDVIVFYLPTGQYLIQTRVCPR